MSAKPTQIGNVISSFGLDAAFGFAGEARWNFSPDELFSCALADGEGVTTRDGVFVGMTGTYTGRSPKDKFTVRDARTEEAVDWGSANAAMSPADAAVHRANVYAHLKNRRIYVQDLYCGADPAHRLKVRVITEQAWHNAFAQNMFIRPTSEERMNFRPDFTVVQAPSYVPEAGTSGLRSEVGIIVDVTEKQVLIFGTEYAGEIKKSIFGVQNFLLPEKGVMPMHCSANVDANGSSALFFGLSGTGKTTLSTDASRALIGDDEHGWSNDGIFNFEGGCYAKTIGLSAEKEPEIHAATRRVGALLENITLNDGVPDFDDSSVTENGRVSYPIDFIPGFKADGRAGAPDNVIMLTADAFGVLPPVAKLSPEEAMYQFLSGYTAKLAGTERGVTEPQATFSTCFGAPFMPRHPSEYAELLGERLKQSGADVWLVNTGWSGGGYGVGSRMSLKYTRSIINAILSGEMAQAEFVRDAAFGLSVPVAVAGVLSEILQPRKTWADMAAYDVAAADLLSRFEANFVKYEAKVSAAVRTAKMGNASAGEASAPLTPANEGMATMQALSARAA